MTSVTPDFPMSVSQQVAQAAQATQRPTEQVVVEWVRPPISAVEATEDALNGLDELSDNQLIDVVRSRRPSQRAERLQVLLAWQQQRCLTYAEREEADHWLSTKTC